MVRAGVDVALAARAHHIARAVLVGAEERAAALDALLVVRLGWIERRGGTVRIARDAALGRELRVRVRAIPVADPLPHVAGDVVQPIGVGWKLRDRRDADELIVTSIRLREVPLMAVRHPAAVFPELVAPRIDLA